MNKEYKKVVKYRKNPKNRFKRNQRRKLEYAIKKGTIKKKTCRVCHSKKVHAHHEDYNKPLVVIWLCAKHHAQITYPHIRA